MAVPVVAKLIQIQFSANLDDSDTILQLKFRKYGWYLPIFQPLHSTQMFFWKNWFNLNLELHLTSKFKKKCKITINWLYVFVQIPTVWILLNMKRRESVQQLDELDYCHTPLLKGIMKNVNKQLSMDFGLTWWIILKINCLQKIGHFEKIIFFIWGSLKTSRLEAFSAMNKLHSFSNRLDTTPNNKKAVNSKMEAFSLTVNISD